MRLKRSERSLFFRSIIFSASCFACELVSTGSAQIANAQSIVPASNRTATHVVQDAQVFSISGGSASADSKNLFHEFDRFQVGAEERAVFQTDNLVENVFALINGNRSTFVDGTLQLSGSKADLFLINPAGVMFGANATLNLPANFTVTTANQIGFGDRPLQLGAVNNYSLFSGAPQTFTFTDNHVGIVENAGNLSLRPNQRLTLLGNDVINTGRLHSPGGEITVVAVPDQKMVRIEGDRQLLSIEIDDYLFETLHSVDSNSYELSPTQLPALLTQESHEANQLVSHSDGTANLLALPKERPAQTGNVMASGVVDVTSDRRTAERDVVKTDRRDRGGNVRIFGDRINLTNLDINASGRTGGGTIHIGGGVQGAASSPQAAQTVISPSVSLSANARDDGNGGEIVVWANEVTEYWGSASARGGPNGGNGGFVEISGKEQLIFRGEVDVSASAGSTGFLLLDPRNIRIINGTGGTDDAQLTNGSTGSAS